LCSLGTIAPGQTATIEATLQATRVGKMPNSVAGSAATQVRNPPSHNVFGTIIRHALKKKGGPTTPQPQQKPKAKKAAPAHPAPQVTG
jgi:hypothetical protein